MPEQLTKQFTIETATDADVAGIGRVHLRSMLESYPNREAGIDETWINNEFEFLTKEPSNEFRRNTVHEAEADPEHVLYLIVRDTEGEITGFFHASRDNKQAKLEAIYLTAEAKGSGVADQLMQRGLAFGGNLPMLLEVVDYNQRAIHFYEKYGFKALPDTRKLLREKLPVIDMRRQPNGEAQ